MSLPADNNDVYLLSKEETAYQVYRTTWSEFYDWEQDYCRRTLQGLQQPVSYPVELPSDELSEADTDPLDESELNESTDWFTFEIHDAQGFVSDVDLLPLRTKTQGEGISPYPSYVTCTPSSSNKQHLRNFRDKLSFTPFADDPMFRKDDYLSLFNSLAWQTDFWDPDSMFSISSCSLLDHSLLLGEMIFLETARRLHYGHGFSFAEIDDLQLHYVRLRLHGSAGMLWEVSQRYVPVYL